mgnify:CR=1 FL=1|tara:strand:- start:1748 stop:2167 length:420 start_codon:yes stop_codon:yes gene_type:complete
MLRGSKGTAVIIAFVTGSISLLFSCVALSSEVSPVATAAASGTSSETITLLMSIGTAIGGLVVWVVKRLINILASEMHESRQAFTDTLNSLREADTAERHKDRQKDITERAKDRLEFARTLRTILEIRNDDHRTDWDSA